MFFFNSFAFLEVEPQFMCQMTPGSDVWTYGTPDDTLHEAYCNSDYNCEINWENRLSLHNLIVQLNMTCAPKWMMGLIGAVFLIGIVVGCSFVTRLGDVYGRKPVYLAGLTLNLVLISILVVNKNVWVAYVCIFLLGVSITARYYVGYTYNLEF